MWQVALVLAIAVLFLRDGYIISPFIALIPLFIFTCWHGTDISLKNMYIREYSTILGFKRGTWKSTELFPDIAVMRIGKSRNIMSFRGSVTATIDESANEVFLLSANHRKRMLIKTCKSKQEAEAFARDLAHKMGKRYTTFNPPVSEQSRARR